MANHVKILNKSSSGGDGGSGFWDSVTLETDFVGSNISSPVDVLEIELEANSVYMLEVDALLESESTGVYAIVLLDYTGTHSHAHVADYRDIHDYTYPTGENIFLTRRLHSKIKGGQYGKGLIATTTAGTLKLQLDAFSSSSNTSTMFAGTTLRYKKVA